jgi:hypothetical protein
MLSMSSQPTTVSDLIRSLTPARVEPFKIYEGSVLDRLPSKHDQLIRHRYLTLMIPIICQASRTIRC